MNPSTSRNLFYQTRPLLLQYRELDKPIERLIGSDELPLEDEATLQGDTVSLTRKPSGYGTPPRDADIFHFSSSASKPIHLAIYACVLSHAFFALRTAVFNYKSINFTSYVQMFANFGKAETTRLDTDAFCSTGRRTQCLSGTQQARYLASSNWHGR
jgi:hypothetical protein